MKTSRSISEAMYRYRHALALGLLLALLGAAVWSYLYGGIFHVLLRRDLAAAERLELVRQVIEGWGAIAPLAYVVIVTIEVVLAPLPGALLYAPGGMIFGGFWGGLLSLLGNVLGAGIACQLMRTLGKSRLEWMWDTERFRRLDQQLSAKGLWVIALLRVNPLTSSDLVSYVAGLTSMPMWKVMLGTTIGMAPLCWAQAYLSEEIFSAFPRLIYPLVFAGIVYVGVAVWAVRRVLVYRGRFEMSGAKRLSSQDIKAAVGERKMPSA